MILCCDFDGVLTTPHKYWYETTQMVPNRITEQVESRIQLNCFKRMSDRDSSIISLLQANNITLVIVSHDAKVNVSYCLYKQLPFIYVKPGEEKLHYIKKYIETNHSDENWIYIGDSIHDFECLMAATHSFIPQDASMLLKNKLRDKKKDYVDLPVNGGEGVLEYVVWMMKQQLGIEDKL